MDFFNPFSSNGRSFLSKKLIISISAIVGGALLCVLIIFVLLNQLFGLGTLNSLDAAGADRFNSNTDVKYEQDILESDMENNITQYFQPEDEELTENHLKYFDALYDAYELYKVDEQEKQGWLEKLKNWIKDLFTISSRKPSAPVYPQDFSTLYGIQIDTSLITATLYNSRYQGDMTKEDKFDSEYSFYVGNPDNKQGYDLHTGSYRDIVENNYLYDAKYPEELEGGFSDLKKAIEGIEVLSKYQIKRIETYYTLHEEFAGTYTDTTRHIELNVIFDGGYLEQCRDYIVNFDQVVVIGGEDYYNRTIMQNEEYEMKSCSPNDDECNYCANQIKKYDDGLYCEDNEYTEKSSDCKETNAVKFEKNGLGGGADIGVDEIRYERDCEDFKEYLLGNLPTKEDVDMFCGQNEEGTDNCYCNRFIESYYDPYVDDDDVNEKRRNISDIVYTTYSMYDFYQNATGNENVCGSTSGFVSYRDLSCHGVRREKDLGDDPYDSDIFEDAIIDREKIENPVSVEVCGTQQQLMDKIASTALDLYNNRASEFTYTTNNEHRANTYNGIKTNGKFGTDCNGFVGYVINRALGYGSSQATTSNSTFTFFGHGSNSSDPWNPRDSKFQKVSINGKTDFSLEAALKSAPVGSIIASHDSTTHHIQVYVGNGQVVDMANKKGLTLRTVNGSGYNIRHQSGTFEIFVPSENEC